MGKLIRQIFTGILGFFLAKEIVPGVTLAIIPGESNLLGINLTEFWQILVIAGTAFGLINFFLKPVLKAITFPLKVITFGLFSFVLNVLIVFGIDLLFPELKIEGLIALLLTTLILLILSWLFGTYKKS